MYLAAYQTASNPLSRDFFQQFSVNSFRFIVKEKSQILQKVTFRFHYAILKKVKNNFLPKQTHINAKNLKF